MKTNRLEDIPIMTDLPKIIDLASLADAYAAGLTLDAVSYTHLTLPTSDLV